MDPMRPGLKKWPESSWQRLLEEALKIEERLPDRLPFSFGGGTALAVHLGHRISCDIDLFYKSVDAFDYYHPNKNAAVDALVKKYSGSWQFPGNYLKLELGMGEIDILVSTFMTQSPVEDWVFKKWAIKIEKPAEILAKKICYRSSQFKRRDIFDMAIMCHLKENDVDIALEANHESLARLRDRISTMESDYEKFVLVDINPTRIGRKFVKNGPDICISAIDKFLLARDGRAGGF